MIAILLLLSTYTNAMGLIDRENERKAVYKLSYSATKAVYAEMDKKADEIYSKFDHILHPFQKRALANDSSPVKGIIKRYLYKSFGHSAIQKIPFSIKGSVEKTSSDLSYQMRKYPPGYQFSDQEVRQFSGQTAYGAQSTVTNDVRQNWDSFQQTEKKKGENDLVRNGLVKRDGSLNKRDILDKIRARFKFFQIDPEKKWWVVPLISIVFILFTFVILLPQLTLAVGLWQTVIQFAIIQPIISKLFLGYYFFDSKSTSVRPPHVINPYRPVRGAGEQMPYDEGMSYQQSMPNLQIPYEQSMSYQQGIPYADTIGPVNYG